MNWKYSVYALIVSPLARNVFINVVFFFFLLLVGDTEYPTFHLDLGELLPSPPSLRIIVYAVNAKGKSEKLVLDDITLNDAEKRTGE